MADLFDLIGPLDNALGEKKTGSKFGIVARRAHRDRYSAVRAVRQTESYLERFLDS